MWDVVSEKKLDKDRFRKDLGNIIQAYQEVARRLGIIHEESNISTVKFGKPKAVNIKKNKLKNIKLNYMSLKSEEIEKLIKEAIPDAEITIQDLAGDENHYSATIKSKIFKGKSKIEQHKIII